VKVVIIAAPIALGLLVSAVFATFSKSQVSDSVHAAVCFQEPPLGAIPPARPAWCEQPLAAGRDTHNAGPNAWLDEFNHGQDHAGLSPAYAHGEANGGGLDVLHFAHQDHWMVDIQGDNGTYPTLGAGWLRPNRSFRPGPDGQTVIEFEVAGPIAGTRGVDGLSDSWPEVVLSTLSSPTFLRANGTYLYENFVGGWTFGCRMQQSKQPICALYEPANGFAGGPTRQWEINQNGGEVASESGGHPSIGNLGQVWKGCTSTQDPDSACRNKFRLELLPTSVTLYVNGVQYYRADLIDSKLGNILNAPQGFYVYFGDFAYRISQDVVVRFHWDRLAVNPELIGGAPSSPTPSSTPSPSPLPSTVTPTPASSPQSPLTLTFNDRAGQNQPLEGRDPSGLIDWGTGRWFLSAPWSVHLTKSISFTDGTTSQFFDFVSPRVLESFKAGGASTSTIRVECSGNPDKVQAVAANQVTTITTNFTAPCSRVTFHSSNGWNTNFDDLVVH
jgi:hypothetical protein